MEGFMQQLIQEYSELEDYNEQQDLIAAFAADNDTSKHSIRARLVKLGIYKNKPKTTKVYKSDLVDRLVEQLGLEVTDSEHEYLNRLTVTLIRKIIKSLE